MLGAPRRNHSRHSLTSRAKGVCDAYRLGVAFFWVLVLASLAPERAAATTMLRYDWVGIATEYGPSWDESWFGGSGPYDVIGATFTGWFEFPSVGSFSAYCDPLTGCLEETAELVWSGSFSSDAGAGGVIPDYSDQAVGVLSVTTTSLSMRHGDSDLQSYEVALDGGELASAVEAPLGSIDPDTFDSATFFIGFQPPGVWARGSLTSVTGSVVPEPSAALLVGIGLAYLGATRRHI
jgi:hypothetical protein